MMASNRKLFTTVVVILCCVSTFRRVHCFPTGAGALACGNMLPLHPGNPTAQTRASPFIVTQPFNSSDYDANTDYEVTLSLAPGQTTPFKGYFCQGRLAHTARGAADNPVGTFVNPGAGGKMLECNNVATSAVTHTSQKSKNFISLIWRSPATTVNEVEIRCTFVQSTQVFFQQVRPEGGRLPAPPTTQAPVTVAAKQLLKMSTAGCGTNKTCYYRPSSCTGASDCDYFFSQRIKVPSNDSTVAEVEVELAARLSNRSGWVAVGYSTDDKMGNDDVLGCQVSSTGRVFAKNLWNIGHSNVIDDPNDGKRYLKNVETAQNNGRITCRFQRVLKTPNTENDLDLSQPLRLLFGLKASALAGANEALGAKHDFTPLVSKQSVRATDLIVLTAKPDSRVLLKTHGFFMIDAWVITSGIGIFLARFMRKAWVKKSRWFWWHRFDMILVWLFNLMAFALVFADVNGFTKSYKTHAALGIIVFVLGFIQPFIALLRCAPGDEKRYIFNWIHRSVGYSAQILALITIYLGINAFKDLGFDIGNTVRDLWIVWVVIALVTFFSFLAYDFHVAEKTDKDKAIPMKSKSDSEEKSEPELEQEPAKDALLRKIIYYGISFFSLGIGLAMGILIETAERKAQ